MQQGGKISLVVFEPKVFVLSISVTFSQILSLFHYYHSLGALSLKYDGKNKVATLKDKTVCQNLSGKV